MCLAEVTTPIPGRASITSPIRHSEVAGEPIYQPSGTSANPVVIPVNLTDDATRRSLPGQADPITTFLAPAAVILDGGDLTTTFRLPKSPAGRMPLPEQRLRHVQLGDINPGDTPTARSSSVRSLTTTGHVDVTSALNAQQLADIAAIELHLVPVPTAGNNNNGSATITYDLPDNAFDFLAAGESVTLTYLVMSITTSPRMTRLVTFVHDHDRRHQ